MLDDVLTVLEPKSGEIAVDCTLGAAGHAIELLQSVGPMGRLIAIDLDPANLEPAQTRLATVGDNFELHATNSPSINGSGLSLPD